MLKSLNLYVKTNGQFVPILVKNNLKGNHSLIMSRVKVAVVTGANKGLGYALVKGLSAKFDGTVYLTSRDEERGRGACKELQKLGLNAVYHQLDITDGESIAEFCSHLREKHLQIDIAINNAGILFLKDSPASKVHQAEETILVNFFALVNFNEAILDLVANNGSIVNISSSSGHLSRIPSVELRKKFSSEDLNLDQLLSLMNSYLEDVRLDQGYEKDWGESPYVVSKVGVNAYTFILHKKLAARGIAVNCVHPGYVISDMTRGAGSMSPDAGAVLPLRLALEPKGGGQFVWHEGSIVPWDGPDPRGFIDGTK